MTENFGNFLLKNINKQRSSGSGFPQILSRQRQIAEETYPFLKSFGNVDVTYPIKQQKGGMGEFYSPGEIGSPNPSQPAIAVGPNSMNLPGGTSDTIIADMVHAASRYSPQFQSLKQELINNLSQRELALAKRRYEMEFRGRSGDNFSNFDNFLNNYWIDGMIQHLLLQDQSSEIDQIKRANPNAVPILDKIQQLFKTR